MSFTAGSGLFGTDLRQLMATDAGTEGTAGLWVSFFLFAFPLPLLHMIQWMVKHTLWIKRTLLSYQYSDSPAAGGRIRSLPSDARLWLPGDEPLWELWCCQSNIRRDDQAQ